MAVNSIVQRISLEGGRELLQALKELGQEGAKAFKEIQAAANTVVGPPTRLQSNLQAVEKTLGNLGQRFQNMGSNIRQVGQTFSLVTVAVTAAAAGFAALAKSGAEAADAMDKSAQKAGLNIEAFGSLAFAAEQNDVAVDQFTTSMGRLNKQIDAARNGSGEAVSTFNRLGISIEELNSQSPDETFRDLVDAFSKMEDGAEKSALAIKVFGRGGIELIPLLNQTREGVEALEKQFRELGLGFTKEQARIGDEFGDNLNLLSRGIKALRDQIGLVFVPAMNDATEAILEFIKNNRETIIGFFEGIRDFFVNLPVPVKTFLVVLGTVVTVLGPLLLAFGLFIQVIGLAFAGLGTLVGAFGTLLTFLTSGGLISALTTLGSVIATIVSAMGGMVIAVFAVGAAVVAVAILIIRNWDAIKASIISATQTSLRALAAFVTTLTEGANAVIGALRSIAAGIARYLAQITATATRAATAITDALVGAFETIWDKARSVLADILCWLSDVIERASRAARAITGVGEGKSSGGGFASGGSVRGPGTSTSDSIPAWLSVGEFVIQAKAVRKYGRAFFANLNAMKLSMNNMGGCAMGGLVDNLAASLSAPPLTGGLAFSRNGPSTTINLSIDGNKFTNLIAPEDTAQQLVRFARSRELAQIGRSPAWRGGK